MTGGPPARPPPDGAAADPAPERQAPNATAPPAGSPSNPEPPPAPALPLDLALRLAVLACLALVLWSDPPRTPLLQGLAVGAVLADVVTWVLCTVIELPALGARALAELLFLAAGIALLDLQLGLARPAPGEPEAAAFLAFLAVCGLKLGWWALDRLELW